MSPWWWLLLLYPILSFVGPLFLVVTKKRRRSTFAKRASDVEQTLVEKGYPPATHRLHRHGRLHGVAGVDEKGRPLWWVEKLDNGEIRAVAMTERVK